MQLTINVPASMVNEAAKQASLSRKYSLEEFRDKVEEVLSDGRYRTFMLVASGEDGNAVRVSTREDDVTKGDLLLLNEVLRSEILAL